MKKDDPLLKLGQEAINHQRSSLDQQREQMREAIEKRGPEWSFAFEGLLVMWAKDPSKMRVEISEVPDAVLLDIVTMAQFTHRELVNSTASQMYEKLKGGEASE